MTDHRYREAGFIVPSKPRAIVRSTAHYLLDYVSQEFTWATAPFPVCALLELWASECGPRVGQHPPNLDIRDPHELPNAAAEFVPHLNTLRVDCDVWDSACNGNAESRRVLAHEIGHVVLKHYAAAGLYRDNQVAVNPETDSEHQANWFADELMMDSRLIKCSSDGVLAIMQRFDVSEGMATRRLRDLILEGRA